MAAIHEFIISLPKGYQTKISELGSNLSSGEKQRIGLARAFLSNGDILILDEPTSNLDTLNEGEILKAIKENCSDKTILLISHRKSTTAITNKTYKLENKTTCSRCKVHCYKKDMREKIRAVMKFSGPRLIIYNPIELIKHAINK